MRAAWAGARHAAKRYGMALRVAFRSALAQIWSLAIGERAFATWTAEQAAEKARLSALSKKAREIVAARTALLIAEHNDTDGSARIVAEARARLHSLQHVA